MRASVAAIAAVLATAGSAGADDVQLWAAARAVARFDRGLSASAEQELRLDDDARGFGRAATQVGARYRVTAWAQLRAYYRLSVLDDETRHRLALDLALRWREHPRLHPVLRTRIQTESAAAGRAEHWRTQLKLGWQVADRALGYAAGELWYRIGDGADEPRQVWLEAGVEWRLAEPLTLATYYLWARPVNVPDPSAAHVLGLATTYRF